MRRRYGWTGTVYHTVELEVEFSGTVTPYHPAVMTLRNGDPGYPAEGGDVEDVGLVLSSEQDRAVAAVLAATRFPIEDRASFVDDILHALSDAYPPDLGDEFREAASDADEPDPDAERDRREDR